MAWLKYKAQKLFLVLLLISLSNMAQDSTAFYYATAQTQFNKGNYAEALKFSIKSLKVAETQKNYASLAYAEIQVGRGYYYLHDKRTALSYFFRANRLINEHAIDSLQFTINYNIGVMYTELILADSATLFYNYARNAIRLEDDYIKTAKLFGVIADLHMNVTGKLHLAKKYIDSAYTFVQKTDELDWHAFVFIKYSIYYKLIKDYSNCVLYARKANDLYANLNKIDGRMYGLNVLAGALALAGNPESKEVYEQLMYLKDSVFGAEVANKMADYQTMYETEKKDHENKILLQQNELIKLDIHSKNQTIIGLIIGVLLLIVTAIWRINVMNLKKKTRELEATRKLQQEKERISRDLHDNVGGHLTYVLFSMEVLNELGTEERQSLTSSINQSIRQIIGNLRETIWAIHDESIKLVDLSDKLKVYSRQIFSGSITSVNFQENINREIHLNAAEGLNLYRICQEIVNNVFKHAQATELQITISTISETIITIADNGKGFDESQLEKGHYGLENIISRAKESGFSIKRETLEGQGTTYTIIV